MNKSKISLTGLYLGALLLIPGSIQYFIYWIAGIIDGKAISSELWYHITLRIHIVLGIVAIFTGPTQMFEKMRLKNIKLHKRMGSFYALSVFLSGLSGLIVSFYAMGSIISKTGLFTLASLWLFSIIMAIFNIRTGNIKAHKFWMYINYGLTFGAVTQRLILLIGQLAGIEFLSLYAFVNWASWMINVGIAITLFKRQTVSTT